MSRAGTVLIVVAGIAALMTAMTVTLLTRMRSDGEESGRFLEEVQARAMLTAGLQYVCETARIGWDDPATPEHEEAFGWIDVRDGRIGPCGADGLPIHAHDGRPAFDRSTGLGASFPAIGGVARCPMRVLRRPPCAIGDAQVVNPMVRDPTLPWSAILGYPNPDPVPVASTWADFVAGDLRPTPTSDGLAWFRVRREAIATFVVTCGAGATQGYRSWTEAQAAGDDAAFGSREAFEDLQRSEIRLHFRCAWSAAVGGNSAMHYLDHAYHLNDISSPNAASTGSRSVQSVGSILWLQRLMDEPADW